MGILKRIDSSDEVSLYELVDEERDNRITSYVASTPKTRAICTRAELVTPEFEDLLQEGIGKVIAETSLGKVIRDTVGEEASGVDFLTILRGGSNFNPKSGLDKIGLRTTSHYVSSQREKLPDGTWKIVQKGYEKLFAEEHEGRREIDLFFGDIVATGTSLADGFDRTLDAMQRKGHLLRSLYFFTIGNVKAEEVIAEALQETKNQGTIVAGLNCYVVHLEGRFGMATKDTPLAIKTVDTDLLTYHEGAIITPEFACELLAKPEYLIEPCVIYDGGKRANSWKAHLGEVAEHWGKMLVRAVTGVTLQDAINERFPYANNYSTEDWRKFQPAWRELDDKLIESVQTAGVELSGKIREVNLRNLSYSRLKTCERMLRGNYDG